MPVLQTAACFYAVGKDDSYTMQKRTVLSLAWLFAIPPGQLPQNNGDRAEGMDLQMSQLWSHVEIHESNGSTPHWMQRAPSWLECSSASLSSVVCGPPADGILAGSSVRRQKIFERCCPGPGLVGRPCFDSGSGDSHRKHQRRTSMGHQGGHHHDDATTECTRQGSQYSKGQGQSLHPSLRRRVQERSAGSAERLASSRPHQDCEKGGERGRRCRSSSSTCPSSRRLTTTTTSSCRRGCSRNGARHRGRSTTAVSATSAGFAALSGLDSNSGESLEERPLGFTSASTAHGLAGQHSGTERCVHLSAQGSLRRTSTRQAMDMANDDRELSLSGVHSDHEIVSNQQSCDSEEQDLSAAGKFSRWEPSQDHQEQTCPAEKIDKGGHIQCSCSSRHRRDSLCLGWRVSATLFGSHCSRTASRKRSRSPRRPRNRSGIQAPQSENRLNATPLSDLLAGCRGGVSGNLHLVSVNLRDLRGWTSLAVYPLLVGYKVYYC